jgi:DNA-binding CsgD family transcriptional regulator
MSRISPQGAISMLVVHRSVGERNFSAREQHLLHFFHQELTPLIGRALVSATEPTPSDLSRRLRQTLACLLQGDSEKQVAARLGLSHSTIHQYVMTLYRRFGVQSRPQLLAHAFRRLNQDRWKTLNETEQSR